MSLLMQSLVRRMAPLRPVYHQVCCRNFRTSLPRAIDEEDHQDEDKQDASAATILKAPSLYVSKAPATHSIQVKIPLPTRGNTAFFLFPGSTVGAFAQDVAREDPDIIDVRLFNEDGTALSSSTTINELGDQDISVAIDDRVYSLLIPADTSNTTSEEQMQEVVTRMASSINDFQRYFANKEKLRQEITAIEEELEPMEALRNEINVQAEKRAKLFSWGTMTFLGLQFGFLARLTWWDYSWDLMEPVSYFIGLGTDFVLFSYFVLTRTPGSPDSAFERNKLKRFYKLADKRGLDVSAYNNLQKRLQKCQDELKQ